jgi:hypothetical protein
MGSRRKPIPQDPRPASPKVHTQLVGMDVFYFLFRFIIYFCEIFLF